MKLRALLLVLFCMTASAAEQAPQLEIRYLDEMEDISAWKSLASDGVSASVHSAKGVQGNALVLEFDLANTAGYAAATRELPTTLPDDYEISFWMRAEAARNNFEVKFVDASGDNVWWYRRANYRFSGEWQQVRIKRRQIDFAWGPTKDRTLRQFQSIEFVLSAGDEGGRGSLWFDRLSLKPVQRPRATEQPTARASSEASGHAAALAIDGKTSTMWRSARTAAATPQTLEIDLKAVREFGGIEIDWARDLYAPRYTIETSLDGNRWQKVRSIDASNGGRDSHLMPESEARYIRVTMPDPGRDVGIAELYVRDLEFGASRNAFVSSLAKQARRGCYPRPYRDEQIYWTIVGVDGDQEEGMLSEDGALEVRKGSFSVEPFVRTRSGWLTWADVDIGHALLDGYLPIPSVEWKHRSIELTTTAYASGAVGNAYLHGIYRLHNPTRSRQQVTLALTVRPFQVNSPAQFLNTEGGVSPIQDLAFENNRVSVDGRPAVYARTKPRAFRAVTLAADTPCDWLPTTVGGPRAHDDSGFASGALLYDVDLQPGQTQEIVLDFPQHPQSAAAAEADKTPLSDVAAQWREKLNRVELTVPAKYKALSDTLRTSLAHVLINRDGPAIQPGSRAYERSWIRDGAMTSEMLLRLGHENDAKEFLRWYARYQFANGKVPCCVDHRGADPVPENDSGGEFLFLIDSVYRYTGDAELLRELWPATEKAVAYMDKLRLSERTAANQQGDRKAFYGLMPASISHEGYSAKPMHSYWDDFWALAGYESAIRIARALDQKTQMHAFIESRDQFRRDLYVSLGVAMQAHGIDYLPGSAELGDFDATSTSIALSPVGEQQMLPPEALVATFERYYEDFAARRTDKTWDAYTPYEWRNLGTFIRLRWRDRGMELIDFLMNDRRPHEWNQWAEVVGREPRRSRFVGDMPHGWVASDFGRSLLDMFAFERPADETLVLMAGVPQAWTEQEGFAVKNLRTPFGPLSYSLRVEEQQVVLDVGELETMPVGGVAIAWPEGAQPEHQSIQRGQARWLGTELRMTQLPFTIVFPRGARTDE
ncbi:MAG TPA: discoidin domain-containing protein [Steroidobacteraceae bacterium]|nr:discoidin domain-containing protein [Steroidobacteraceae bacterium]